MRPPLTAVYGINFVVRREKNDCTSRPLRLLFLLLLMLLLRTAARSVDTCPRTVMCIHVDVSTRTVCTRTRCTYVAVRITPEERTQKLKMRGTLYLDTLKVIDVKYHRLESKRPYSNHSDESQRAWHKRSFEAVHPTYLLYLYPYRCGLLSNHNLAARTPIRPDEMHNSSSPLPPPPILF